MNELPENQNVVIVRALDSRVFLYGVLMTLVVALGIALMFALMSWNSLDRIGELNKALNESYMSRVDCSLELARTGALADEYRDWLEDLRFVKHQNKSEN